MHSKSMNNKMQQNRIISFGFQPPIIDENHYVAGDGRLLGATDINPSGDWEKFLPIYEPQAKNFETYSCTTFGATSQIEIMMKFLYNT